MKNKLDKLAFILNNSTFYLLLNMSSTDKFVFINYPLNDITEINEFNGVLYPKNTYYFCYEDNHVYKKIGINKFSSQKFTFIKKGMKN